MEEFNGAVSHVLVSSEEIDEITTRLAAKISKDFEGKNLVLLGILKGSVPFMSDLMRKISLPAELEFMKVSSYGAGTVSSGKLNIHLDVLREGLENCDILVIEDIIDSGRTLKMVVSHLYEKGARSVKTCTLLDKPSRREVDFTPDYVGKEVPDYFVVGYGLDFDEKFRTLPYVGIPDFAFNK
ncbi:MAG: hypoxanthine phosphoribosyltransferase [Ruminococcaceae bacterium]|nr:hypoxanthine phosphoribosyltransferase [Oscillospiraceae bacterium]